MLYKIGNTLTQKQQNYWRFASFTNTGLTSQGKESQSAERLVPGQAAVKYIKKDVS